MERKHSTAHITCSAAKQEQVHTELPKLRAYCVLPGVLRRHKPCTLAEIVERAYLASCGADRGALTQTV
eukprot:6205523-Pleurochrysis_carterae.AAC.1